jgi:hypothetical protein
MEDVFLSIFSPYGGTTNTLNQQRFDQNFAGDQGHDVLFGAYELGCSPSESWH